MHVIWVGITVKGLKYINAMASGNCSPTIRTPQGMKGLQGLSNTKTVVSYEKQTLKGLGMLIISLSEAKQGWRREKKKAWSLTTTKKKQTADQENDRIIVHYVQTSFENW